LIERAIKNDKEISNEEHFQRANKQAAIMCNDLLTHRQTSRDLRIIFFHLHRT